MRQMLTGEPTYCSQDNGQSRHKEEQDQGKTCQVGLRSPEPSKPSTNPPGGRKDPGGSQVATSQILHVVIIHNKDNQMMNSE